MEIFNFDQGSDAWFEVRRGIPTASEFSTIMAKGHGSSSSKTRRKYMMKLIGEKLTGESIDSFSNEHMKRGSLMEKEARDYYAFLYDIEPEPVGFIRNGPVGCSPDGLIGEDGLLEIKTKLPHLHLEALLKNKMPSEHKPQVQGQLCVSGRQWCDFMSYWPKLPPLVVRVHRDDEYIETIKTEVFKFLDEMTKLEQQIISLKDNLEAA